MELELRSKAIRERLGHPVIDADGHYIEFGPSILEFMKETAGARVADAFVELNDRIAKSIGMTTHQRRDSGIAQEGFWITPAKNTWDRAAATMPRVLHERLDEFGFDLTVLYPSAGLLVPRLEDEEMRRASCRAFNCYLAAHYRDFADRITPAAVIPCIRPTRQSRSWNTRCGQLG
jgi:hypothetical protein